MTTPNYGNNVTLIPAGTVITATGTGTAVELDNKGDVRADLVITAASGTTPSITVLVQCSSDNGVTDSWRTAGTFGAQTATTTGVHIDAPIDRYIRAQWTVSGTTPSFTVSCFGEAV
jgi:hypothetical protein